MLLVRDDAIALAKDKGRDEVALELGRAVLQLCEGEGHIPDGEGRMTRQLSAPVFNHGNGVEWAGERHTDEEDLFVWGGNCLRPISAVGLETLERIQSAIEERIAERRGGDGEK